MIRLQSVLNTSLQESSKTSWKCLEDVLKTSWKRLEDVLKTYDQDKYIGLDKHFLKVFWRRLGKTSWKRLEDVLKTYDQDKYIGLNQDVLKRLEDVFWTRMSKDNMLVLIKMSSEDEDERRFEDVLKTSSSRRMFARRTLSKTSFYICLTRLCIFVVIYFAVIS